MNSYHIKILIKIALVASAFVLFYFFVQAPRSAKLKYLAAQLRSLQEQIQQIESVVAQGRTLQEGVKLFQQSRKNIDSKFPAKEEEGLKGLSDLEHRFDMEITSFKSTPRALFLLPNHEKVEIEGKACHVVYVSVEMKGTYGQLIQYIQSLKESLPAYVSVEKLRIIRDGTSSDRLSIFIDFNLYLLS